MQQSDDFEDDENDDLSIDSFLRDYVDCPCTVIWDGDASSLPATNTRGGTGTTAATTGNERKVIIGGGTSPHRRLPEQFAWTLSRFVENKVSDRSAPPPLPDGRVPHGKRAEFRGGSAVAVHEEMRYRRHVNIWREILPPEIERTLSSVFSSGSLLVSGRAIASMIIYISLAKVGLVQYKNIRNIRSSCLHFSSWGVENHIGKLGSVLGRFSRRMLVPFSFPVISSRRERRVGTTTTRPDSDSCETDNTTPGESEQQQRQNDTPKDGGMPQTPQDLRNLVESEDSIIQFDRKRENDTTERSTNVPYLDFFTLDQVIS